MKMLFATLMLVILGDALAAKPLFLVPTHLYGNWTAARPGDVRCPPFNPHPELNGLAQYPIKVRRQFTHHELEPVEGHLCHALTYRVSCSVGFFGGQTITRKIERSRVEEVECRKSIQHVKEGSWIEPYFPAADCVWMADTDSFKSFQIPVVHPVRYDPYSSKYVDGLFFGTECASTVCHTVHENTIWISSEEHPQTCSPFKTVLGTLYFDRHFKSQYVMHTSHNVESLLGACVMTYCGEFGMRSLTGSFLGGEYLTKELPHCPPGTNISVLPDHGKLDQVEVNLEEVEFKMSCMTSVQALRGMNKADFLMLAKMTPKYPGNYMAYRIRENSLEKVMARWDPIDSFILKENTIGKRPGGDKLEWHDWVPSGVDGLSSGFNGVHKTGEGAIIVPDLDILQSDYSDSILASHDLVEVPHPHEEVYSKEGLDGPEDVMVDKSTSDVAGWISGVWDNIWGKFTTVVVLIGILVGILILVKCFGCPKCKPLERHPEVRRDREYIELQSSLPRETSTLRRPPHW